jgi:NTP pyrophosphatase (non-canonical NTP hydrolase)
MAGGTGGRRMTQEKLEESQVMLTMNEVIDDVINERLRQIEKYGHQEGSTSQDWLTRIIEEIGEAAQALQKGTAAAKNTDADNLYEEVVQAGALCVKWAETLKGYKTGGR